MNHLTLTTALFSALALAGTASAAQKPARKHSHRHHPPAAVVETSGTIVFAATCTGAVNCRACKNCRYCKHCSKRGGTCGVCRPRR